MILYSACASGISKLLKTQAVRCAKNAQMALAYCNTNAKRGLSLADAGVGHFLPHAALGGNTPFEIP